MTYITEIIVMLCYNSFGWFWAASSMLHCRNPISYKPEVNIRQWRRARGRNLEAGHFSSFEIFIGHFRGKWSVQRHFSFWGQGMYPPSPPLDAHLEYMRKIISKSLNLQKIYISSYFNYHGVWVILILKSAH